MSCIKCGSKNIDILFHSSGSMGNVAGGIFKCLDCNWKEGELHFKDGRIEKIGEYEQ